jgi:hypothetical protein
VTLERVQRYGNWTGRYYVLAWLQKTNSGSGSVPVCLPCIRGKLMTEQTPQVGERDFELPIASDKHVFFFVSAIPNNLVVYFFDRAWGDVEKMRT